jgi:hypothetical protein
MRCRFMRTLLIFCALGGCDPVWHIENAATAQASTQPDAACIEDVLRASGYPVKPSEIQAAPVHGWYVGTTTRPELRVTWDPRQPQTLALEMLGVGTQPPTGSVPAYRTMRDAVMTEVAQTCGPFELGPESCARLECTASESAR